MRLSIDLPEALFLALKALAAERGTTVKRVILAAVEQEVRRPAGAGGRRLRFPLLDSREPGTLNLAGGEIDDLLT